MDSVFFINFIVEGGRRIAKPGMRVAGAITLRNRLINSGQKRLKREPPRMEVPLAVMGFIQPTPKDLQRGFDNLQRDLVYARDKKKCQVCGGDVSWKDAQIHHVEQHSVGGKTEIENGALVHAACHPLGATAVSAFAFKWNFKRSLISD